MKSTFFTGLSIIQLLLKTYCKFVMSLYSAQICKFTLFFEFFWVKTAETLGIENAAKLRYLLIDMCQGPLPHDTMERLEEFKNLLPEDHPLFLFFDLLKTRHEDYFAIIIPALQEFLVESGIEVKVVVCRIADKGLDLFCDESTIAALLRYPMHSLYHQTNVNWTKQPWAVQRANMKKGIEGIMYDTYGKGVGLTKEETCKKLEDHIDTTLEGLGYTIGKAITTEEARNRVKRCQQSRHLNATDLKNKPRRKQSTNSSTERKKRTKFAPTGCQYELSDGTTCGKPIFLGGPNCPKHDGPESISGCQEVISDDETICKKRNFQCGQNCPTHGGPRNPRCGCREELANGKICGQKLSCHGSTLCVDHGGLQSISGLGCQHKLPDGKICGQDTFHSSLKCGIHGGSKRKSLSSRMSKCKYELSDGTICKKRTYRGGSNCPKHGGPRDPRCGCRHKMPDGKACGETLSCRGSELCLDHGGLQSISGCQHKLPDGKIFGQDTFHKSLKCGIHGGSKRKKKGKTTSKKSTKRKDDNSTKTPKKRRKKE